MEERLATIIAIVPVKVNKDISKMSMTEIIACDNGVAEG
jgi:hypothetical protein